MMQEHSTQEEGKDIKEILLTMDMNRITFVSDAIFACFFQKKITNDR